MPDQTGRAYDEAQERAFRALPWHVRLKAHLMGFLTLALAFGTRADRRQLTGVEAVFWD